jgi:acid stress-induced BolA-like protein IbaG/YrbA
MVKIIGLIVIFLSLSEVTAQKVLQKIVDAQNVEQISINGDGMFKIEVISEARNTIEMISEIEGEYAVNTMLNYTVIGEVLFLFFL